MGIRSVTAQAWFAICVLCTFNVLAQFDRDPYPGESIAHYLGLGLDIVNITDYADSSLNVTDNDNGSKGSNTPSDKSDTAQLDGRDIQGGTEPVPWKPSPGLGRPSLYKPAQAQLSATYNDTDDRGYNITIPGCTPADSIVGDWEAPSGTMIENCTLAQMSRALSVPPKTLTNFTIFRTESLLAKLNTTLQNGICEPPLPPLEPPDRELKADRPARFRFNPETQTGYFSSLIILMLGSFGISFTGLHLGIIHEGPTANITLTQEVMILSTFATFGTMCVVLLERERRRIGHAEAVVLNLFLALADKIYGDVGESMQCIQEAPLAQGMQTIAQKLSQGARMLVTEDVQAAAMKTAGSSSVNLVSQWDVENQLPSGTKGLPDGMPSGMMKDGTCQ